jgi:hypothetical protein
MVDDGIIDLEVEDYDADKEIELEVLQVFTSSIHFQKLP